MRRQSKKNPWRNTRNDFEMPWNKIYGVTMVITTALTLITLAPNVVLRSGVFYSYFLSKTGIVKEIPYAIEMADVRDTFTDFMWHKMQNFTLMEKEGYMPQLVFTNLDNQIMNFIRNSMDIMAIIGIITLVLAIFAGIKLFLNNKKDFMFNSYKISMILTVVLMAIHCIVLFVPTVRGLLFVAKFGNEYPPGDVLLQIFDAGFAVYYGIGILVVGLVLALGITYLMVKFVARRKMF